ncbi:hypothetical protein B6I21_01095 [candidate division KSB1 bacterium 4572_119]|nr:MAG: hypothetical protein B6I21_01095 [candidate division KSB1 bacterium 4572_119]
MKYTLLVSLVILSVFNINDTALAQEQATELKVGDMSSTFFLKTLKGQDFFLRDYCGKLRQPWKNKTQHIVILSFFATWCKPCMEEIPILEKISHKYSDKNVKIFLVDVKEKKELVSKFIKDKNFQLPVLLDIYGVISKKYQVEKLPKLIIVNRDGRVAFIKDGFDKDINSILSFQLEKMLEQ